MRINIFPLVLLFLFYFSSSHILGNGISQEDNQIIVEGGNLKYIINGMIHMLEAYDHLLFIFGILFLIKKNSYTFKLIATFTIAYSLTFIIASFYIIEINPYLVDVIIAFTISYIAFINLNGFKKLFNIKPISIKYTLLAFGIIHGLGLSNMFQQSTSKNEILLMNIISYDIGILLAQTIAMFVMYLLLKLCSKFDYYKTIKLSTNVLIYFVGLIICYFHIYEYINNPLNEKMFVQEKYEVVFKR